MRDEVEEATMGLRVWTASVPKGQAEDLLRRVTAVGRSAGADVLVMKGEHVFGSDHVRTALYHARRAIRERTNASDSVAMETLLYSSGERQLSSATKKMSVDKDTEEVAIISLAGTGLRPEPGWEEMPRTPKSVDRTRLIRFGITDRELTSVSPERAVELVLERVAAVDIVKK